MSNLPACCKSANRGPKPEFYLSCGHLLESWLGDLRKGLLPCLDPYKPAGQVPVATLFKFPESSGIQLLSGLEKRQSKII